ncbi:MAG: M48 family metallopeptidase [Alphaproteobacteria bacterium]|nr:M48 family metallopeptidase [Alphaproteobacteria bacterium]
MIFDFENHKIEVRIENSVRAKYVRLKIDRKNKCAVLVVPRRVKTEKAIEFAQSKIYWIYSQISKIPEDFKYCEGAEISFLGQKYTLHLCGDLYSLPKIEENILFIPGKIEFARVHVLEALKRLVKPYIVQKIQDFCQELGVTFSRVRLTETKSRWGSCSSKKVISICWRLGFADPACLDYVIAHEVAHLKELNHSVKFWKIVGQIYPNYLLSEKKLKGLSKEVFRF